MTGEVGVLTILQYTAVGIGFVTSIVAARLLGPGRYGVVALLIAYPNLVWSFASAKSMSVSMRYIAGFRANGQDAELRAICKLGYLLDALSALGALILVVAFGAWVTGAILHLYGMAWLAAGYAASLPFLSLTGTSWAILSSVRRFGLLGRLQIFQSLLTFALVLVALLAKLGVMGMVLATSAGNVIAGLVMTWAASRVLQRSGAGLWWKGSIRDVASARKEMSSFFGWNYLSVTLSGVLSQAPLLILGRFRGPAEAGYYRIASNIATAGAAFEGSVARVTYPILSARWAEGERETLKATLKRWRLRGGIPLGLLLLSSIPLLPIAVPLAFGDAYKPMVLGAQLMMAGAAVSIIFFYLAPAYYAAGRFGFWAKTYGVQVILVVAVALAVVRPWGFSGVAGVVGLGNALFNAVMACLFAVTWEKRVAESV
jgi:O-antigen/teichoic acid export membrane protein